MSDGGVEKVNATRRRSQRQLFPPVREYNVLDDEVIGEEKYNGINCETFEEAVPFHQIDAFHPTKMHKSTKTGLIGIAVVVLVFVIVLLFNLPSSHSNEEKDSCVELNGEETCFSTNGHPFRYYGTKTSYHIATPNKTVDDFKLGSCKLLTFYLLSRHATRYPDVEDIEKMISRLPVLQDRIVNSFLSGKASICEMDVNKLKSWNMTLVPEDDNRLSDSGVQEAIDLAQRYKDRFPTILKKAYSSQDFVIEYTSRERTRSTAEAFAEGLFGKEGKKSINFDGKFNDAILQFHKNCKTLQKKCKDSKVNLDELEKFEEGPFLKSVARSVSKRLGFDVTKGDIKLMSRACAFGYALEENDIWCSVFSSDELKVLEYEGDLDDYYKDGYGNAINYEQACPVVNYVVELFKSSMNNTMGKAVLHFSHAGAVKKIYPRFGLFRDAVALPADGVCSNSDRQWKSSLISPFNSNLVLMLMNCNDEQKIVAFHNEQIVQLGGCSSTLCPIQDFFEYYDPISENCDNEKLCGTCDT